MRALFTIIWSVFVITSFSSCVDLGDQVSPKGDDYYYNKAKTKIIYCPGRNWYELAYNEMDVDLATFTVLSEEPWAKDKNHIYYSNKPIELNGLDLTSFYLDGYTPKDKSREYSLQSKKDPNDSLNFIYYFKEEKELSTDSLSPN